MRGLGRYVLPLILLFWPGWLAAQYVGAARPLTGSAVLDSLAAKSDTAALRAVRTVQDSLASDSRAADSLLEAGKIGRSYYKAGSNVTLVTHGTPGDSATISAFYNGSDGGGGGLPYDTTLYRRILGWPSDSALYGTFSGWRMLDNRTAKADSASGDSLWSNIDQLKSTGGRILLLGIDTVHVYRLTACDSLPTAGGISKTVTVQGTPRTVIQLKDGSIAPFSFTINRPAGTGSAFLEFRDLRLKTTAAAALLKVERGRLRFDNCDMDGGMLNIPLAAGNAGDSLIIFNNCRLNDAILHVSARMGFVSVENCEGNIATGRFDISGPTEHAARCGLHFINSRNLGIGDCQSNNGGAPIWISGGSMRQTNAAMYMFAICNIHASGVQFYFHPSVSATYAFIGAENSYSSGLSFEGCSFWGGGAAGASIRVTGCYFYGSPKAVSCYSGGAVSSCVVQSSTIAVAAQSTTKIHGLLQNSCSTFISGSPAAVADTMTVQ